MSNDKKNPNDDQPQSSDEGTIKPGEMSTPASENLTSNDALSDYTTGQPESRPFDGNEGKRPAAKTEIIGDNALPFESERTEIISSGDENTGTEIWDYSKDNSNRGASGSGSAGKSPISSDERVRRQWEAAIGSSGKASGESLRLEPPEEAS